MVRRPAGRPAGRRLFACRRRRLVYDLSTERRDRTRRNADGGGGWCDCEQIDEV